MYILNITKAIKKMPVTSFKTIINELVVLKKPIIIQ